MDMHFPIHDFTVNADAAKIDTHWLRSDILCTSGHLAVYASQDYALRKVCTLDDLRMVVDLLSSLFIGSALGVTETSGLVSTNTGWTNFSLLPKGMTSQRMFELLEEGKSYQLHTAGLMAFMDRLPCGPAVRGSLAQAAALERLATLGESVRVSNFLKLERPDARHIQAVMDKGLTALDDAGRALSAQNLKLLTTVVAALNGTRALIALDAEKIG